MPSVAQLLLQQRDPQLPDVAATAADQPQPSPVVETPTTPAPNSANCTASWGSFRRCSSEPTDALHNLGQLISTLGDHQAKLAAAFIEPARGTPESVAEFQRTGDYSVLRKAEKPEARDNLGGLDVKTQLQVVQQAQEKFAFAPSPASASITPRARISTPP